MTSDGSSESMDAPETSDSGSSNGSTDAGSSESSESSGSSDGTGSGAPPGAELWTRIHDGPASDIDLGHAVATDPLTGDVYAAGVERSSAENGGANIWLRKYSPAGDEQWTRTHDGPAGASDSALGLATGPDGEVVVVGTEQQELADGGNRVWVRKLSASGDEQWTHVHEGDGGPETTYQRDGGAAAAVAFDGSVYAVGRELAPEPEGQANLWIRKLDGADGAELWTRTHDGTASSADLANAVAVDGAGDVHVVGFVNETATGADVWVRKLGADGSEVWTRTYDAGFSASDVGHDVAVDSSSNVIVVGGVAVDDFVTQIWVRKYDADGTELWTRTHEGTGSGGDVAYGVATRSDDAVVVCGQETGTDAEGGQNIWLRVYGADGDEQWTRTHDGPASGWDQANGVAVDPFGDIVVIGTELDTPENGGDNIWLRKYAG